MCWVIPPNSPATTSVLRMASSRSVLPWSTWPITVTTGGRGTSRDSSIASSSSAALASSSMSTISTVLPSSPATSSMAASVSDWVIVTISPAMSRVFTISAGVTPSFSARSWGDAPRATRTTASPGASAWASGAGSSGVAGSSGSAAGASTSSSATAVGASACPSPPSVGRRRGSRSSVAVRGLMPGLTLPPAARNRGTASSGTVEEAVRPSYPISSREARMSLLGTPNSLASSWILTFPRSPPSMTAP